MAGATGGSLLVGEDTGKAGSFTCKRRGGGCRQLTGKKKRRGKKKVRAVWVRVLRTWVSCCSGAGRINVADVGVADRAAVA